MEDSAKIEKARELFLQGFNCSQAVFCAFAEDLGLDRETALKVSASFGGGIGRMRETCGAVCGAAMVIGMLKGQTEPDDNDAKKENYHAVQQLAEEFKKMNGSIKCSELLSQRSAANNQQPTGPSEKHQSWVPDARTAEYYRQRPCLRMVESAVRILLDKHF